MVDVTRDGSRFNGRTFRSDRAQAVLNTRDLIVYGIMMMFPLAPVAVYGACNSRRAALVPRLSDRHGRDAVHGAELWRDGRRLPRAGSTYTLPAMA